MNLTEIQTAVRADLTVCWKNPGYRVINPNGGKQWLVIFIHNQSCVGLFRLSTGELIGDPEDFYVLETES